MKKIELMRGCFRTGRRIIFCLMLGFSAVAAKSEPIFNYAEYKLSSAVTIPTEETGKKDAVGASSGLKLSFRDADVRSYVTLPKTEFEAIKNASSFSEKLDLLQDVRYGAGIFLFKKTVPTTIKIGHNTYAKSVSKLKNPSPSSIANPLSKSFAFSTGTGASLPTLTSSVQPLSCSVSVKNDEKIFPILFAAEGFFNEDKESVVSVSAQFKISRSVFIQSALSCGRFFIENNSTILAKNNAEFDADFFYSGLAELCFHSPFFKINFFSGIQESPYEVNPFWFKIDGRTSFNIFLLNFSYFAIPTTKNSPNVAPLIGGSSSICRTVEQASINPQVIFLFDDKNASALRLGFSALENWKVTATNIPVQLNTAKLRAGASYESRFFAVNLDWTHANILRDGEPPTKSSTPEEYQSVSLSGSYSGTCARFSVSGNYAHYPSVTDSAAKKETSSADFKAAFPKLNLVTQTGIELTFKDGERYAGNFSVGASYIFKRKYIRAAMKAEVMIPF